ncbi:MAG: DtxR family transcriptional regulator [candidate division WS1 bacterium]|jgi:DtxR family Mn-dependent transcriptional regulator|nr:DtxR family transcriptional regulator [candidate division WS1 bacterium]
MTEAIALSESLEDYLEAIYQLQRATDAVRVKEIADFVGVKMPSVTAALGTLKERGLVVHERYGEVALTETGRTTAEFLHRRHYALTAFLRDILGLDPAQAEEEACGVEHALSPETLRRLLALIDFLERCPRGGDDWLEHMAHRWEDIPCARDCAACISAIEVPDRNPFAARKGTENATTLDRLSPGMRGKVLRLGGEPQIRRRLMDMGVTPGAELEVERLAPLGDPIEIEVRGYHLSLRKREAAGIAVEPL